MFKEVLLKDFIGCIPSGYNIEDMISHNPFDGSFFNLYVLKDTDKGILYRRVMDYFTTYNIWLPEFIKTKGIFDII